jgi:hypothetical protein
MAPIKQPASILTRENVPRFFLISFLAVGYLCTCSPALNPIIGAGAAARVGLFSLLSFPVLLLAAVWAYEKRGPVGRPFPVPIVLAWALALIAMLTLGLLSRNPSRLIAFDVINLAVVIFSLILGRRDEVWRDLRWPVAILSAVSVVCSILFTDRAVVFDRSILNEQAGATFEPTLALVTLFAMVAAADKHRRYFYVSIAVSLGALFVYLYFARRGNMVRCLIEVVIALIFVPLVNSNRKRALAGVAVISIALATAYSLFPLETLVSRFRGDFGLLDTLTSRNERLLEARLLFEEFSLLEVALGRGLGGSFLQNSVSVEEFVTEEFGDYSGKYMTHGGIYYPILKGGLAFALIYYLPVWLLWFGRAKDPISRGVALGSLPWLAFQFIEGAPTHTTPWVGLGIGLILSRWQPKLSAQRKLSISPVWSQRRIQAK